MASWTTGLIKNTEVLGGRQSSTFSVQLTNADPLSANVRINGFYWTGATKSEYVLDIVTLGPRDVVIRDYYAQFDALEFGFVTSSDALEVSVCGKDAVGTVTTAHYLLPAELMPTGMQGSGGEPGVTIPNAIKQIHVLNSSSNTISVIDGTTNTFIGNIIVGSGPFGIGVNSMTNRLYVANFGSSNVSVIDGNSNTLITTVTVGTNPVGVGVNPTSNRIYIANWGSRTVSVIDGFTLVVIATIPVGASPKGVTVNPATNLIYITHQGSNSVSVIDGSTNSVIASVGIKP